MTDAKHPQLQRLIALIQRELAASSVRLLDATSEEADAENVLYAKLPDGRRLAVAFAAAPKARDVLERRLRMLTATFTQSLTDGPRSSSRPHGSLQQELRALAVRVGALEAAVIDAHSPVLWGAGLQDSEPASPEKVPVLDASNARLVEVPAPSSADAIPSDGDDAPDSEGPRLERVRELTERATEMARDLRGLDALRKGGHVAEIIRDHDALFMVRSFASIYLLIVIFEGPYDEVRAERAIEDALPRIERLVLALPPLDPKPAPMAGVISLRRGVRRR